MKKIIISLIICIILVGCSNNEVSNNTTGTQKLINDVVSGQDYIILDVRTNDEFIEEHVKGAINIPYDKIDKDIELEKDKYILVYCKSGKRSSIAYDTLKKLGYEVYNLGAYNTIDLEKEKGE